MPDAGEPGDGYLTVRDPGNQAVLERLGAQQGSQPQAHSLDLPQHGRVRFVDHALHLPSMLVPQRACLGSCCPGAGQVAAQSQHRGWSLGFRV